MSRSADHFPIFSPPSSNIVSQMKEAASPPPLPTMIYLRSFLLLVFLPGDEFVANEWWKTIAVVFAQPESQTADHFLWPTIRESQV